EDGAAVRCADGPAVWFAPPAARERATVHGRDPGASTMNDVLLYDTTLRDGTQRENISLSRNDKVKIAQRLDAFGIPYIEGGWPGSNPKDVEFFARIREVPLAQAKI